MKLTGTVLRCSSRRVNASGSKETYVTNLLVLAGSSVNGVAFAARMAPAWLAAVVATGAVVLFRLFRTARGPARADAGRPAPGAAPHRRSRR